ncbi:MAG: NAD(P)-dependent oxidoreductase [Pseudomonadota bacterium]
MAVLVTGATGVVGINVLEELLSKGHEVVSLSATPLPPAAARALAVLPGRLHLHGGDTAVRASWDAVASQHAIDRVIHAAAITPNDAREQRDFRRIVEVNFMGTIHALEAARDWGVRRFVYCSSGAVYGDNSYPQGELAETVCPSPQTLYAVMKQAGEGAVARFGQLNQLDVVVARIGAVFGRWEHDTGLRDMLSAPMQTAAIAEAGGVAVLPRRGDRDWIYGPDVAQALVGLLTQPELQWPVYNVGPGASWSVVDWCEMLKQRFPGFRYQIADETAPANVDFHSRRDRSQMSIARLRDDIGFEARYGLARAFNDYLSWRANAQS